MAQNQTEILNKILHVVTQIRDQGGKKPDDKKSDAGTGTLSDMFGKKKPDTKKLKDSADTIKSIFTSITDFNKVKVNTKRIDATSKSIKGLFDVFIYIGKKRKIILNVVKLFDVLAKSLSAMSKFAKAMTTLLMSVGLSILAIAGGIALAGVLLGTKGRPLATMGVIVATLMGITGAMVLLGMAEKWVKPGAKTADKMGDAMKSIGIGLVVFVGSLLLISHMLKFSPGPKGMAMGVLTVIGVIGGMALVFAGLGMFAGPIKQGTGVAVGMAIGMAALALGVLALVSVAALMTSTLGKGEALNKKGEKRGQFGQMMANIGPGLGVMGIVLVSSGLLFAGLGAISWLIIPGVVAGLLMAVGMIAFAYATKKILTVAATIGKPEEAQQTIAGMVSAVFTGLIDGVTQSLNPGGKKGIKGFAVGIKNTAILTTGIGLLMGVSVALSMFAYALTAFAELDNMRVITGYDEKTGKPKFGPTVNIKGVGDTVRDTLVSFLVGSDGNGGLLDATEGLTRRHAAAIGRMGRALTGRRGILTAIIQFADVLKTFAQFGPEGKIGYVEMVPDGTDEDGNPKFKQVPKTVLITEVTGNITDSFTRFAEGIAAGVTGVSRSQRQNILNISEALMGKKRSKIGGWFVGDKPGLLEPINAFSDTLMIYAKFGADGSVPILDKDGNPTGKSTPITKIVTNIVTAISKFSSELSAQLTAPGETVKDAQKKMEGYMGLLEQLGVLSVASEGLDKTATSIMSMATSMNALADAMNKLETDKLEAFAEITKNNNTFGSFLKRSQDAGEERRESRAQRKEAGNTATSTTSSKSSQKSTGSSQSLDTDQLANSIGSAVAAAFKNGQFTFQFQDNDRGVLSFGQ